MGDLLHALLGLRADFFIPQELMSNLYSPAVCLAIISPCMVMFGIRPLGERLKANFPITRPTKLLSHSYKKKMGGKHCGTVEKRDLFWYGWTVFSDLLIMAVTYCIQRVSSIDR